jgi:lipoprotein-releasing system ATP-binding protein
MNIDIDHLSKSYYLNGYEIPVLKDISFSIKKGDLISLTGPSGVGKSTFLHVIGTLDVPTSGSISYDNCNIQGWCDARVAAFRNIHIGYVFQFHHLMSEFTAIENVMMPLLVRRIKSKEAKVKACEMLSFVGLSHRIDHKPGELSGGEQQRVALARALVHEPTLLLADEPTGNLDEKTGQEIVDLVLQYNKIHGITVLLVTHNQRISSLFAKKLILDKRGLFGMT